jgi:hypothetical protein
MEIRLPVNRCDENALSSFVKRQLGVDISVLQCQLLFRGLRCRFESHDRHR